MMVIVTVGVGGCDDGNEGSSGVAPGDGGDHWG